MREQDRIPVIVLTGPLGSGKTTILNRLLQQPRMTATAVIINELGAIGLDHLLVRPSTESLVLLDNGCLCCTVRGDLIDGLRNLGLQRRRGEIPAFERVIVETTGLADPVPIIHSLMSDISLVMIYRLGPVVTAVDAVNGPSTLQTRPEASKQVAMADLVLLTKTDLVPVDAAAALDRRLAGLAPEAERLVVTAGGLDPAIILEHCAAPARGGRSGPLPRPGVTHDGDIQAHCFIFDRALPWQALAGWLDLLAAQHGPALLRVKGIVDTVESPGRPLVVHGIHHLFHPPETLEAWPGDDRRTRIVFITQGLPREAIAAALRESGGDTP